MNLTDYRTRLTNLDPTTTATNLETLPAIHTAAHKTRQRTIAEGGDITEIDQLITELETPHNPMPTQCIACATMATREWATPTMQQITIVECGEYDDHQILAVFEAPEDAQAYADDYNKRERPAWNDRAVVGQLDFHPAGTYHRAGQVVDGRIVEPAAIGR